MRPHFRRSPALAVSHPRLLTTTATSATSSLTPVFSSFRHCSNPSRRCVRPAAATSSPSSPPNEPSPHITPLLDNSDDFFLLHTLDLTQEFCFMRWSSEVLARHPYRIALTSSVPYLNTPLSVVSTSPPHSAHLTTQHTRQFVIPTSHPTSSNGPRAPVSPAGTPPVRLHVATLCSAALTFCSTGYSPNRDNQEHEHKNQRHDPGPPYNLSQRDTLLSSNRPGHWY
jgi:hypothetical protein